MEDNRSPCVICLRRCNKKQHFRCLKCQKMACFQCRGDYGYCLYCKPKPEEEEIGCLCPDCEEFYPIDSLYACALCYIEKCRDCMQEGKCIDCGLECASCNNACSEEACYKCRECGIILCIYCKVTVNCHS